RGKCEPGRTEVIIIGDVLSGGGNITRFAALETDLFINIPGLTVDRQCGSGLKAIALADKAIRAGEGDVYIAGGIENMSRSPYLMDRPEMRSEERRVGKVCTE